MRKMEKVYFVGAGPGEPELLTLKGQRLMQQADVVIYTGSLINRSILKYAKSTARKYDSAILHLDEIILLDANLPVIEIDEASHVTCLDDEILWLEIIVI